LLDQPVYSSEHVSSAAWIAKPVQSNGAAVNSEVREQHCFQQKWQTYRRPSGYTKCTLVRNFIMRVAYLFFPVPLKIAIHGPRTYLYTANISMIHGISNLFVKQVILILQWAVLEVFITLFSQTLALEGARCDICMNKVLQDHANIFPAWFGGCKMF